jgi:hypothetical protein
VGAQEITIEVGENYGFGFYLLDFGDKIGMQKKRRLSIIYDGV